jgi:protein-S-isoprenylcysteine O-methyltransferase Ste14
LTDEELGELVELNKKRFDYGEWLALKYAQDWAFLNGAEPQGDYVGDFLSHYSVEQREYIRKVMRMMRFMNSLGNTLSARSWSSEGETRDAACIIRNREYHGKKEAGKDGGEHPRFFMLPPVVLGAVLVAGFLLHKLFPLTILSDPGSLSKALACILFITAGVVMVSTTRVMLRKKTDPRLDRPTTTIVTEGCFKYSRNPLYSSLIMIFAGIAAYTNSLWLVLLLPVLVIALERAVVRPEEEYLEGKFGEEYLQYKNSVRRWI